MIKRLLKKILLQENKYSTSYCCALEDIIINKIVSSPLTDEQTSVSAVIFSKDRAIQLHALLASYFELVEGEATVYVLYTASSEGHKKSYLELQQMFLNKGINFIQEKNFRADLLTVLETIHTSKLFFLVDDIIFTEPLKLTDFTKYNTDRFVPSLRLGKNLTYAYTMQSQQPQPAFLDNISTAKGVVMWKWDEGTHDWGYPLSVDGHLFDTSEIKSVIKNSDFKAPNSLEESMQVFNPIFKSRLGIAFTKSIIINIPCNKVQQENENIAGNIGTEELLNNWNQGLQINYKKLRHFSNISAHQEVSFDFAPRKILD